MMKDLIKDLESHTKEIKSISQELQDELDIIEEERIKSEDLKNTLKYLVLNCESSLNQDFTYDELKINYKDFMNEIKDLCK